jgi:hypothetical protein
MQGWEKTDDSDDAAGLEFFYGVLKSFSRPAFERVSWPVLSHFHGLRNSPEVAIWHRDNRKTYVKVWEDYFRRD